MPGGYTSLVRLMGSSRIRLPVAAKMAAVIAGAITGAPGSPTPACGRLRIDDGYVDFCGRLFHACDGVVVKIGLGDAAGISGDFAHQRE